MTHEQFLQWLDEQIEYFERMAEKQARKMEPDLSYMGACNAFEAVKEKFIALLPPPTTLS
jgi:hypothetical protein